MNLKLINTEETIAQLVALIREARKVVYLVSPYVTMGADDRIGRVIKEALNRRVQVFVIIRQDDQTPIKQATLDALIPLMEHGLKLSVMPALHAKIYISDAAVLVTSLNLLSSSFLNTVEVGLCSTEEGDRVRMVEFLKKEIFPHLQNIELPRNEPHRKQGKRPAAQNDLGYCIRCLARIDLDPEKPYCRADYAVWAEYSNEDYEDDYCHGCGRDWAATMSEPLCDRCERQSGL